MATYRVTVNGFWCQTEALDDSLDFDGFSNEVFISVNTRIIDSDGQVLVNTDSESQLMGDTWRYPNRVQAGTRHKDINGIVTGGIVSGDMFPSNEPWKRTSINANRVPPYLIWEGELGPTKPMVMLTPTIWEWDPGTSLFDNFVEWQVSTDAKYGQRAKEIFGGIWPVASPIFDAVSLGIQTAGSLFGMWSLLGAAGQRPIGVRRDPTNPDGYLFSPQTLALNHMTAEFVVQTNLGYVWAWNKRISVC